MQIHKLKHFVIQVAVFVKPKDMVFLYFVLLLDYQ